MAPYDIVGNVAIIKFPRGIKSKAKKAIAKRFLASYKHITTILEKSEKFKGRLRTQKTKYIAGVKTKEALHKENGCEFRFNVDSCYFSPRLSNERKEIAKVVKRGERVLVMFGGVGVYAIVISKLSKAEKIISVEISKACNKYAEVNVKRNKVKNVGIVQGDVRRVVPALNDKFDRIIMARPNLEESFLSVAFGKAKKGTIIHYYGFYSEDEMGFMRDMISDEAELTGKKIKILKIKKAGDIGVRAFRYRADVKVLS